SQLRFERFAQHLDLVLTNGEEGQFANGEAGRITCSIQTTKHFYDGFAVCVEARSPRVSAEDGKSERLGASRERLAKNTRVRFLRVTLLVVGVGRQESDENQMRGRG